MNPRKNWVVDPPLKFPEKDKSWRVVKATKSYKTWWVLEHYENDQWVGQQEFDNETAALAMFEFQCAPLKLKVVAEY